MPINLPIVRARALPLATTGLFALFVIMLPRYTDTAKTWFVLLILLALGYLLLNLRQLGSVSRVEGWFMLAVMLNFAWIALTFYANGQPGRGETFLWGRHFYALFMIPLFFLFRRVRMDDRVLLITVGVSVVLSLGDILIDVARGIDHRLQGMNPNGFGPIQLCLSGILLFYFLHLKQGYWRWFALAAAVLGLATVIFSKSKSTWMTLAVLSVIFAVYLVRAQPVWKRLGLVTAWLLVLSSSYYIPTVQDRIDHGINSIDAYFASDDYRDDSRLGSFGTRVELWKTGWYIFTENPLLGVGVGGFKVMAKAHSERYRVNDAVHDFKYVHNQYVAALATRGLPGLILFLSVMTLPIYIALHKKTRARPVARLALIHICLVYLIGCLAEDHFEAKSATMFTGVLLPLLLARISCAPVESAEIEAA